MLLQLAYITIVAVLLAVIVYLMLKSGNQIPSLYGSDKQLQAQVLPEKQKDTTL